MKIGLALSGGGALGVAHIGVIETLERNEVPIDLLCGTSAGAIIGLLYCDGGLSSVYSFMNDLEDAGLTNGIGGLLSGTPGRLLRRVEVILRRNVRAGAIPDLKVPFSCIATDIVTGEMVVIDSGDPVAAVLASASVPGVFSARQIAGRLLVDGGITRNLPADIVQNRGADFVIASNLYRLPRVEKAALSSSRSRIRAALRAIEIMQMEMSNAQLSHCGFCFSPPIETFRWYDFDEVNNILDVGRGYAELHISELLETLKGLHTRTKRRRA